MTTTSSPKSENEESHPPSLLSPKKLKSVLTNLQRGNTEADVVPDRLLNFHEKAGQGEITVEQAKSQPDIDEEDVYECTPLHYACFYGQLTAVQILTECGANVNKMAPDLASPLILAASMGHSEIAKYLLARGADVHHMDILGNNALIYAAAGNHPHTCNELLGYRPDLSHSNEDGETAFSMAIKNSSILAQAVIENYLMAVLTS